MGQKNHEETIRAAYVRSLVISGTTDDEANNTAGISRYRNMFKTAEADAYRAETGHKGAVSIVDLAAFVDKKYPECTVAEQGELLVYTLEDFKQEALACKNQYHLTNWAEKHKHRIKKHLEKEEEIAELRTFVGELLVALRGDPPMPAEPPSDMCVYDEETLEDEPTDWKLAVEFDALCTEEQIKLLAGAVSKVLRSSPFVIDGSCKMVTRAE